MRSLALLTVILACCYYYYRHQQPASAVGLSRPVQAAAATPALHYHSPLDAGSARNGSGYYSTAPAEHYEVTGPRSTASGRAALTQTARTQEAPPEP